MYRRRARGFCYCPAPRDLRPRPDSDEIAADRARDVSETTRKTRASPCQDLAAAPDYTETHNQDAARSRLCSPRRTQTVAAITAHTTRLYRSLLTLRRARLEHAVADACTRHTEGMPHVHRCPRGQRLAPEARRGVRRVHGVACAAPPHAHATSTRGKEHEHIGRRAGARASAGSVLPVENGHGRLVDRVGGCLEILAEDARRLSKPLGHDQRRLGPAPLQLPLQLG